MTMVNLSYKDDFDCCEPVSQSNKKERHPVTRLRENVPKFIMNKDLKKVFELKIQVRLIEKGIETNSKGDHPHAELELLKMDIINDTKLRDKLVKLR